VGMSKNLASEYLEKLIGSLDKDLDEDILFIAKRPPGPRVNSFEPIIFSDELKYLNTSWGNWSEPTVFTSHRPIYGKIICFLKRKIQAYLFNVIFKDYFNKEREFNIKLVQFCNLTARYIDAKNEQLFWDLVKKVDNEIDQVNERNDTIISEFIRRNELTNKP